VTADASATLGRGVRVASLATSASVSALQRNATSLQTSVGALSSTVGSLQNQFSSLQGDVDSLFDLSEINRRETRRANEGVAMALAMDTPYLPNGATFAVSGGFGYYNDRTAGSASFAARIGENAALTGGLGIGFNSREIGARGGFQLAW